MIRTLRKLSGLLTDTRPLAQKDPYVFEDYFTGERFTYTPKDDSIYTKVPVGGHILAITNKGVWVRHRIRL